MEYRLNKIDTDLRQKINDATKEGKVHGTKNISISKDKPKKQKGKLGYKPEIPPKKSKLIIEATKAENIEIEVYKDDIDVDDAKKGTYINTKI